MMPDKPLSYCQIMIGRVMTGLVGLEETLQSLWEEGVGVEAPDLGERLVQLIKANNYVPNGAVEVYIQALVREYRRHVESLASGEQGRVWRDPRKEQKPWYPTIFAEKCDGCGLCIKVCPHSVLGWNPDETKALVLEPHECAPGCQLCVRECPRRAIILPPTSILHQRVELSR